MPRAQSSVLAFPSPVRDDRPLPDLNQPRERLLRLGASALSDGELLGLVVAGRTTSAASELGRTLLDELGGFPGLLHADEPGLRRCGLSKARRAALLAFLELNRRIAKARMPRRDLLDRPDAVANYLLTRYSAADQEVMGALYLNTRNRLIAEHVPYRGTLYRTAVEPRAILKQGLLLGASTFVLFHTHPSGDPSPSEEDHVITRRFADAGELLGIRLVDHLILGSPGRWVSLGRRGAW